MAEVSIGDAIGAGFQLIRHRPLVVVAWGLPGVLTAGVSLTLFGPLYFHMIGTMMASGATANPITSPELMAQTMQMQGAGLLLGLLGAFVDCVVYCAVFRAVILPEQSRFAYLRVGAPELFALVLVVAGYIAFIVTLFVSILVIAGLVAAFVAAHATAIGAIIGVLGGVALAVALVYVLLRLSLVVPMMVNDGKFHFGDAWALTRRHAGALFVIGIAIFAILLIAESIVGLIMLAIGGGYISSAAGGWSHLQDYFQRPFAEILGNAAPLLLVMAVIWIPLTGCVFAIIGAPWARAYRDLSGPDLAATFS